MTRLALFSLVLSGDALAHAGHGALDTHLHVSPELLLLAGLVAAFAAWCAK